jgi:hypothetical protein
MSLPLGPSSDRSFPGEDLVDELSKLLSSPDSSSEKTAKIQDLFDNLVKEIDTKRSPSEKLLARVQVLILPMIDMSPVESINAKIRILSSAVSTKITAVSGVTLRREMLKATIESCQRGLSKPNSRLIEEARTIFSAGGLKNKDDIHVIEFLIQNNSNFLTPIYLSLDKLPKEAAPLALNYLISNYPNDFIFDIFFICNFLSSLSIFNEIEIVDLFSRKEDFAQFIPMIVGTLHSQEQPSEFYSKGIVRLLFNAFLMKEGTSNIFSKEVIKQLDGLINSKTSISTYQMNFIIQAFDLISDKTEAVAKLETWKAQYPKISLMPEFNELERVLSAEKIRELERDPVKKDIDQHTSELWRCVGRREDPTGVGFLYDFKLKPEYLGDESLIKDKMNEIYPAIEFHTYESFRALVSHDHHYLPALGYQVQSFYNDIVITLPDRNALIALYNRYRESHRGLPELSIISSPGIATDKDFVQAMIKHDAIIADGKEFIHDHTAHILILLQRILRYYPTYTLFKAESTEHYQLHLDKIEQLKSELIKEKSDFFTETEARDLSVYLPVFETLLGALVDTLSSYRSFAPHGLEVIIMSPEWRNYLKKRYSQANHDASPDPKPPVFDDTTMPQIRALLPIIKRLPVIERLPDSPDH